MSLLKDIVIKGIYYNSIGIRDDTKWSKKMLDYFGPEIKQSMKDIRKWSVAIPASDYNGNTLKQMYVRLYWRKGLTAYMTEKTQGGLYQLIPEVLISVMLAGIYS